MQNRFVRLKIMGNLVYPLVISLALLGCRDLKYTREFELNQTSFEADTLADIEKDTGIDIPDQAKGLKFHYIPSIDPITFAKIAIPQQEEKTITTQLNTLSGIPDFPKDFANDRCPWWPSSSEDTIKNALISRNTHKTTGYYIEAYLVRENGQLILYLKYFTI